MNTRQEFSNEEMENNVDAHHKRKMKMSVIKEKEEKDGGRTRSLTSIRELLTSHAACGGLSLDRAKMASLMLDARFLKALFTLFDDNADGLLEHSEWVARVKMNLGAFEERQGEKLVELMDLMEAITFLVCGDKPVNQDMFYKIHNSKGVLGKWICVMGTKEEVTIEDFMALIIKMTTPGDKGRDLDKIILF